MNTNIRHNYFRATAIAIVLTVSSASAQQPIIAPQGTVVYHNGQQMMLTPVQDGHDADGANGQPRRVSIPAGSPIYVRLTTSISSNRLAPGAPVEASLDAPLEVNGTVIAERGARVAGRITESDATRKATTKAAGQ